MLLGNSEKWLLLAGIVLGGWLVHLLAPVLTPFVIAALLAYLGDPLVDRLVARGLSRSLAVVMVFLVLVLAGLALLVVLLPLLERQLAVLMAEAPAMVDWLRARLLPHLRAFAGVEELTVDAEALGRSVGEHWQAVGGAITRIVADVFHSGQVVVGWLVYALLVPVVTFYLLRDWDLLIGGLHELLPRRYEARIAAIARECDAVLAEFLRGQLLVMLCLGVLYTAGLWLVGLELALVIGMLAGLVSFVPYLGFIVGVVAAGVAAAVQFQDLLHPLLVLGVFAVGQLLEGMILSPLLVGERIGLHPVAVIFAVMAGGQLFGFFGILLALPAAALIVVLMRHARTRYLHSGLYTP